MKPTAPIKRPKLGLSKSYGALEVTKSAVDNSVTGLSNYVMGTPPQQDTTNMIRNADIVPFVKSKLEKFSSCMNDSKKDN